MITRCLDDGGHKYRKAYDGRKGFKFMKIKKLVAMLATAAMAVGLIAVAPTEAKAAKTTKVVVNFSDATNVKKVVLDPYQNGGGAFLTSSAKATTETSLKWGRDLYEFTKVSGKENVWSIEVSGEATSWANMQIVVLFNDNSTKGCKYYLGSGDNNNEKVNSEQWNANDTLYFTLDAPSLSWQDVSASTTDPTAAKASDVIAKIDAIGTVEYTDACLKKIEEAEAAFGAFTGNKSDITNSSKIADAKAKYAELKAAAMGKVTVYVKNAEWSAVKGYTYPEKLGGFPGTALQADAKNAGWYVCSVDITDKTIFVFGDGKTQTEDLNIAAKGTYWLELSPKGTAEKYAVSSLSTTAPTGWVGSGNGGSGSTPTPTPTPTPEAPDTADVAPVVAMVAVAALAAVVVLKKRTVNE